MTVQTHRKVATSHLQRDAYLYVRQATVHQEFEKVDGTRRQYALRERAVAMGWLCRTGGRHRLRHGPRRDIERRSRGVSAAGWRSGNGAHRARAVSRRLAADTQPHRLVPAAGCLRADRYPDPRREHACAVYDPNNFNDRLVLGIKGTMSMAETYVLRARQHRGILSQVSRCELKMSLSADLVCDPASTMSRDHSQEASE